MGVGVVSGLAGCDEERGGVRRTILHMAAMSGNYKLVETLLELQADKNVCDRWGQTPLV